jgi:iron complex transport system substrate-binding protein
MKGKSIVAIAIVAIVVISAAGVGVFFNGKQNNNNGQTNGGGSLSFIDGRGVSVTFTERPQRILSLGSAFTEMIFAMDAQDLIVGVDSTSTYPDAAKNKTNLGSAYSGLDIEKVIALNPDAVISWTYNNATNDKLEARGYKVLAYYPKSVEAVMGLVQVIGNLTSHTAQSTAIYNDMSSRLDAVKAKYSNETSNPWVYAELRNGKSPSKNTMTDSLLTLAGGRNINNDTVSSSVLISKETIVAARPDWIFVEDQSTKTSAQIASDYGIPVEHVVRLDGTKLTATPRIMILLEQVGGVLHPAA